MESLTYNVLQEKVHSYSTRHPFSNGAERIAHIAEHLYVFSLILASNLDEKCPSPQNDLIAFTVRVL